MRFEAKRALVIGEPTGKLAAHLAARGTDTATLPVGAIDEEQPIPGGEFDLIANVLSLDTVNDLPGALLHLRGALAPGGIAICALAAAGSLPALRAAMLAADGERPAARIHPMVDAGSGAALLQRAGFSRQVADSFQVKASYTTLPRLVADLRDQGLTGILASQPPNLGKSAWARANEAFAAQADESGRTVETFEVLMLTGWKS